MKSLVKALRRKAKRTVAALRPGLPDRGYGKVFCVGWLRTGTTSFGTAMQRLGFRHFRWDPDVWNWYRSGRTDKVLRLARHWESFDDLPWNKIGFLETLDRESPGSRYVLLEREPESWLKSMSRFAERMSQVLDHGMDPIEFYRQRNQRVRDHFRDRPDDLLVMDICGGDGYEVLCPFLDVPVPGEGFPHVNKGKKSG